MYRLQDSTSNLKVLPISSPCKYICGDHCCYCYIKERVENAKKGVENSTRIIIGEVETFYIPNVLRNKNRYPKSYLGIQNCRLMMKDYFSAEIPVEVMIYISMNRKDMSEDEKAKNITSIEYLQRNYPYALNVVILMKELDDIISCRKFIPYLSLNFEGFKIFQEQNASCMNSLCSYIKPSNNISNQLIMKELQKFYEGCQFFTCEDIIVHTCRANIYSVNLLIDGDDSIFLKSFKELKK